MAPVASVKPIFVPKAFVEHCPMVARELRFAVDEAKSRAPLRRMIPLEDAWSDIVAKAQRGLGLEDDAICSRAAVPTALWSEIKGGLLDEPAVQRLAPLLGLHADSLIALAKRSWYPEVPIIPGVRQFRDVTHELRPNAYIVHDQDGDAAIIDTTTQADLLVETIQKHALRVAAIFLTHTHGDHVAELLRLKKEYPNVTVYVGRKEPLGDATLVDEGQIIHVGDLELEVRVTTGHSAGGVTYVVRQGLSRHVALVGDALFAGSMGGGGVSWADALANNRHKLFTLSDETVICPGHGPMSSIGQEKLHNPFYPEFKS